MKLLRPSGIFIIILLILSSCKTHQPMQVRHIRNLEPGHNLQGFYYALPRTVVQIELNVIHTEEIPGPFAQFAGKYLGIDNVIMQRSSNYRIADIQINHYAEPDPGEYYFVEYNAKTHKKNPFSLTLTESGLISCVNTATVNDNLQDNMIMRTGITGQGSLQPAFNPFLKDNLQEKIDTIVEKVRIDTITIERQTLRRSWVEKTSEVRAKEVAEYILRIRNKKFDLISGFAEITYSSDALQYMHDKLEEQENAYLELFTGITTERKTKYTFTVLPHRDNIDKEQILFYFSETEGILSESRRGAEPISVQIGRHHSTRQLSAVTLTGNQNKNSGRGIFYRIPEYGFVSIKRRNNVIGETRLLISQFGMINPLPASDLKIEFYPGTGTIRSVEKIQPR